MAPFSDGSNHQDSKGDSQEEVQADRSGPSSRRPLITSSVKPNVNVYLFSLLRMGMCFQTVPEIPAHLSRTSLLQFGLITLITISVDNVLWDDFNTRGIQAI